MTQTPLWFAARPIGLWQSGSGSTQLAYTKIAIRSFKDAEPAISWLAVARSGAPPPAVRFEEGAA